MITCPIEKTVKNTSMLQAKQANSDKLNYALCLLDSNTLSSNDLRLISEEQDGHGWRLEKVDQEVEHNRRLNACNEHSSEFNLVVKVSEGGTCWQVQACTYVALHVEDAAQD